MNKHLILLAFAFVILIGLGSATEYIAHKQNTELQFSISSNNATSCNVTTMDTPQGVRSLNISMTKNYQTFYATISSAYLANLGSHCFNVVCTDGTNKEGGSVCRDITPSGFTKTTAFFFVCIVIILLIVVLGVYARDNNILFLGSILILIFGFFIIKNGVDIIKDTQTTWAIGLVIWAIGLLMMFKCGQEYLNNW